MRFLLIALLFVTTTACGLVDPLMRSDVGINWDSRPADFPQDLKVVVMGTDQFTLNNSPCTKEMPLPSPLMILEGCAETNFDRYECYVWFNQPDDGSSYFKRLWRHEVDGHCRGYDHPGDSSMADGWEEWKRVRGR